MPVKGRYITNPAALAFEWREGKSTFQLTALRGVTESPILGVRVDPGDWVTTKCADNWKCNGTLKDFKRLVREFTTEIRD